MSGEIKVGIIMGSDSDLGVMQHAGRALETLGLKHDVDYEERVISAHRTPNEMIAYAETAEDRGLQIIIAGAGGSAHLQGMTASHTLLPVLGVAITREPDVMNRALGSNIGMPEGKPLAVFQGEVGAFNAGLFAARMLMRVMPDNVFLRQNYNDYEAGMHLEVRQKDELLKEMGAQAYLQMQRELGP